MGFKGNLGIVLDFKLPLGLIKVQYPFFLAR